MQNYSRHHESSTMASLLHPDSRKGSRGPAKDFLKQNRAIVKEKAE